MKKSCFGLCLEEGFEDSIHHFLVSYRRMQEFVHYVTEGVVTITVSWKVHILSHLPEYFAMSNSKFRLGKFCEQAPGAHTQT